MATADNRHFSLTNTTKDRVPTLPFLRLKEEVLGQAYDLSLVVIGDQRSRTLNETYRKKTYTPNVLSFPIGPNVGEIFLNMKQAKRESIERDETITRFTALLVVHGLLHLKGMRHGSTMEKEEERILLKYRIR